MSDAMTGSGTVLQITNGEDTSSGWTTLAEVTSLSPPSYSTDVIDVSSFDSQDNFRDFLQGMTDPGEMSLGMNFVPGSASDDFIGDWRSSREIRNLRITFPNSAVMSFRGFVTGYEIDAPFDDKLTASLTVKVTGPITMS